MLCLLSEAHEALCFGLLSFPPLYYFGHKLFSKANMLGPLGNWTLIYFHKEFGQLLVWRLDLECEQLDGSSSLILKQSLTVSVFLHHPSACPGEELACYWKQPPFNHYSPKEMTRAARPSIRCEHPRPHFDTSTYFLWPLMKLSVSSFIVLSPVVLIFFPLTGF